MEEKISQSAIVRYSQQYTRKVLDRFYAQKTHINGQELLQLTEVEQINLFIIQMLFRAWKTEMQNSRSVYFNYDAEVVKQAQQELMNVLSRHIYIERNHLEPLLQQATAQALNDVLNPYDFFSKLITGNNNELIADQFKEELKYLKLNKAPLLRLSQILQERKIQTISGNEAFSILDTILEDLNFTPEDIEPLLHSLSIVEAVKLEDFYDKKNEGISRVAEQQSLKKNSETKTAKNNFTQSALIKDSLTINQKFMFTKALFGGDFEKFSEAINAIDKQNDFDDALAYLAENLKEWDQESEEFHEFMELVEKRFN